MEHGVGHHEHIHLQIKDYVIMIVVEIYQIRMEYWQERVLIMVHILLQIGLMLNIMNMIVIRHVSGHVMIWSDGITLLQVVYMMVLEEFLLMELVIDHVDQHIVMNR